MGLRDLFAIPHRIRDPVPGTARVVSSTDAPDSATSANVRMTLVVQAEGIPAYSTELHCMCRLDRWPHPGETLPVVVDRDDPHRLRVDWDRVVPHRDRARAQADQIAESLGGFGSFGTDGARVVQGTGMSGVVVNVTGGTMDAGQVADALRMAETMTGMDLDGDGRVGHQAPPAAGPAGGGPDAGGQDTEDRIARLERLARLRERGVLTDEEFAAEKARVLGGP